MERPITCSYSCGDFVNQLELTLIKERDLAQASAVFVKEDLVVIVFIRHSVIQRVVGREFDLLFRESLDQDLLKVVTKWRL